MTHIEEFFTNKISLTEVAVIVIAFNLGYVYPETETLNGSTNAYLELSGGIKVVCSSAAWAMLLLSAYYHIRQHHKDLCDEFSIGYRYSKNIKSWLSANYPSLSKDEQELIKTMAPIQGSLINKKQNLGTRVIKEQQRKFTLELDTKTHYSAVCNGIQRILCKRFPVYGPLILAIVAMPLLW